MFLTDGIYEPVLIDISEMLDIDGNVTDVVVRYSILPTDTNTEETSSNGF